MQERRQPEIIGGYIASDGSIARGDGFSCVKAGTGLYDVTITAPGFRLVAVTGFVVNGGHLACGGGTVPGERTFRFNVITSNTAAAVDGGFMFTAVGVQQ